MQIRLLPLAAILVAASTARAEETSYVRQMAKDKSNLYLVCSGPGTRRIAEALLDRIKAASEYKDEKGKTCEVVDLADFGRRTQADAKMLQETVVLLVAADEKPSDDDVARLGLSLPKEMPYVSTLNARVVRPANRGLSFRIAAVAPDAERVSKLIDETVAFRAPRWDELHVERSHLTHKITVHAPEGSVPNWSVVADDPWNVVKRVGLGDSPPARDEDPEMDHAYLIDRSHPLPTLPAEVTHLAKGLSSGPATTFAISGRDDKGRRLAVLCAPSARLLRALAASYPSIDGIPETGLKTEALDLRRMGPSAIFVSGDLPLDNANVVRGNLERNLRQEPSFDVKPRGEIRTELRSRVEVRDLSGRSEDARRLREDDGIRYAWLLSFSRLDKGTSYSSRSDRTTPPPPKPGAEPLDKSSDERGPKAQKRAHDQWVTDHKAWEEAVRVYETTPIKWVAEVKETRHASVRITISLINLADDARVVWEETKEGSAVDSSIVSSRTVEVHGMRPIIAAPVAPVGNDECPERLVEEAGTSGGLAVLQRLGASAWLSGDPAPGSEQIVEAPILVAKEETAAKRPAAKVLKVANGQITIDLGAGDGLTLGDRVVIGIEDEPSVIFRVISVGETATCEPLDAKNRALAVKVRKGDKVERIAKGNRP